MQADENPIEVAVNITDRKRMEQVLRESERKYRDIFESSIEGIFQSTLDGRFINANPAAARMLGYESPEDLVGTMKDMGSQLYAHPEDRDKLVKLLREHGFVKNFEVLCRNKNGSAIWGVLNIHLVRDDNGNTVCLEGTCQDITERKRTEKRSEERREGKEGRTRRMPRH